MDRNDTEEGPRRNGEVATREGGVDRNAKSSSHGWTTNRSPPARVAWIETFAPCACLQGWRAVATREGGVDRNIEVGRGAGKNGVATREGGVDRNTWTKEEIINKASRHPRGWRG